MHRRGKDRGNKEGGRKTAEKVIAVGTPQVGFASFVGCDGVVRWGNKGPGGRGGNIFADSSGGEAKKRRHRRRMKQIGWIEKKNVKENGNREGKKEKGFLPRNA